MKNKTLISLSLTFAAAMLMTGCHEEKKAAGDVMFAFSGYIMHQDAHETNAAAIGSWSAIGFNADSRIKEINASTNYSEFFEIREVATNGLKGIAVASKVEISGCPTESIWGIAAKTKPEGYGVRYECVVEPSDASKAAECEKIFPNLKELCK